MKAPFFYAPGLRDADDRFILDEASSRHCIQVLRHQPGDTVLLTDGAGTRSVSVIETADKKRCVVALAKRERMERPAPSMAIAVAFTKHAARMEWFLEKATEIGITEIFPLRCTRSEKIHANQSRLRSIMVSAMLQSQQYYLPELHDVIKLEDLLGRNQDQGQGTVYDQRFMAHCEQTDKTFLSSAIAPGGNTLVMIGPEGDFTPEEIAMAASRGYRPVSLGETRLRTETAAMVACVLMQAARHR